MKATKKPITVEYYPCEEKYLNKIMEWSTKETPIKRISFVGNPFLFELEITTPEGKMYATDKDMIIKGVNGEVYPCKKDIFDKTYNYD